MTKTLLWMNRRCWLAVGLLTVGHCAQAQTNDSQAVSFARQAGIVAGAAQACGQPIALMTSRTAEVIATLATDSKDVSAATGAYKRAIQDSAASQTLSQQLTCNKVVNDFNKLPLLQPDYQQQVIEPLTKDMAKPVVAASPTATTTPTTAPASTNPAATTTTTPAAAPAPAMPAINGQQAAVPVQQMVTGGAPPTADANAANPSNGTALPNNINTANLSPEDRVRMAQKLTDMAASLLNTTTQPQQFTNSYGQNVPQTVNGVGANNPSFNNSLGVTPYPSGQTSNSAIAASDPGLQPYPQSPALTQSYPP